MDFEDEVEFEEIEVEEAEQGVKLDNTSEPQEYIDPSKFTDETVPQAYIDELKMLGMPKPENITWNRWNAPKDYKIQHEHILHLYLAGATIRSIAKTMDYSEVQLYNIMKSVTFRKELAEKRKEMFGKDYKNYISSRVDKALAVLDDILDDEKVKAQTRLAASQLVIEHTVGKPQQTVEHKGNLLAEVIATAEKQLQTRDVADINLEAKPSAVDNIIEKMIPTGVVVGKRGS